MMKANWSCFSLLWHRAPVAFIVAFAKVGKSKLARIAMTAMTTSSSMSVKPKRSAAQTLEGGAGSRSVFISLLGRLYALLMRRTAGAGKRVFQSRLAAKNERKTKDGVSVHLV